MSATNFLFHASNKLKCNFMKELAICPVRQHFTVQKEAKWLGYYRKTIYSNTYLKRKENYRKTVLKPLEEIPSLEERLKELNVQDPVLDKRINIGFSKKKENVSVRERLHWRKEVGASKVNYRDEIEINKIDLSEVKKDWLKNEGQESIRNLADHYGIFSHLYQHGYFSPCVSMSILYDYDDESVSPVHSGNILQACEASKVPQVYFESKPDDMWTLVLTNLDGHLLDTNSEYLHWFIGNIKGNDLQSGEVVCDYLQPFPMRGTGYHRLVFVLYKQDKEIDFSNIKRSMPCLSLEERTFRTFDFYKEHQDSITPAGLSFFQCTWDESLTDFFHNVLNMQEPIFEYIVPEVAIRPQVKFPHLQPFNMYLDRYRDPKEIKKEVLLKRLKTLDPFKEEPPMPKYPTLHKPDGYRFSWQRDDMKRERLRIGKYRDLRPHSVYPQEDSHFNSWDKS